MARHDQRPAEHKFVCTNCKAGDCTTCVDVLRILAGLEIICNCGVPNHAGEPRSNQILDPTTGTVYAPGLRVTADGEVIKDGAD